MFLPYGVNDAGALVYIKDVPRGRLAGVYCPYCGVGLLARKGRKVAHHFAHDGDTCNASQRDQDAIGLPAYDRFDLALAPRVWKLLQGFYRNNAGHYDCERLATFGLVTYNPWSKDHELTTLGKIPAGLASLPAFAEEQDRLIWDKHRTLEIAVKSALSDQDRQLAITDLQLYRAQLRRVLSATLYLLEIQHQDGTLYKIGVTTRDMSERITEVRRDLSEAGIDAEVIRPLRVCAHRGAVELYFTHRYRDDQFLIGTHREYFTFEPRRHVLADLTKLGDKVLNDQEHALLAGEPSEVDPAHHQITVTVAHDTRRDSFRRTLRV